MKVHLIPLGLRCNSAMVVNSIINQPRMPFDWTQMNVDSMVNVIKLQNSEVKDFWTSYFSMLDSSNHHSQTQSWFPHDTFTTVDETAATIEKYTRRTERFIKALESDIPIVFLLFFGFPELGNLEKTKKLIDCIEEYNQKRHFFIICNATFDESRISNIFFIFEKLEKGGPEDENGPWNRLTERVESRVRKILSDLELTPI